MKGPRYLCSSGLLFDVILVSVLLVLIYAFVQRQGSSTGEIKIDQSKLDQDIDQSFKRKSKANRPVDEASQRLIDNKIESIKDVRSKECIRRSYNIIEKVSLIVHFNDYQFYDLKNTLTSALGGHRSDGLIGEIVVVDDGSTLDHIIQESQNFLASIQPKTRLIRNKLQLGSAKSRQRAVQEAKMDIVVFIDTTVICSPGWLEPLMNLMSTETNTIAVPHFDRIKHPVSLDYEVIENKLVASMSWSLEVNMRNNLATQKKDYDRSPAIRGNIFAVRKSYLEAIGSIDDGFEEGGGESLELSLRTWMCGGSIKIDRCSRVGLLNLYEPVKITSLVNARRITGLWFGDGMDRVLRLAGLPSKSSDEESKLIQARYNLVTSSRKCQQIDWYLKEVAAYSVYPSPSAKRFGTLRAMSGSCTTVASDGKIDMAGCNEFPDVSLLRPEDVFEFTVDGRLLTNGKCLTALKTAHIMVETCRPNDVQQQWHYKHDELINTWSSYCATHVTDPDHANVNRQVMMAQKCNIEDPNHDKFKKWNFIAI